MKRGVLPATVDERADRWTMIRLVAWGIGAVLAVVAATFAARTHLGAQRVGEKATADQIDRRDAETKRLARAVRLLSADRDRLATGVASLERTIDDLTGSIDRLPLTEPPTGVLPGPITPSPAPTLALPAPAPIVPVARRGSILATLEYYARSSTAADDPAASVPTVADFGVDLGGANSVDGLRALWASLRAKHAPLLKGLWPIMLVRDRSKPGTFDLRLVAGPLPNAEHTTRLCATFAALGVSCQPAVFNGQKMALR
jgi:hypothetical protein